MNDKLNQDLTSDERQLTLGSLFDGSGGFPLGAILNGIRPVFASEIEPFPIMVTKKRLPFMKHLGDVSKIDGAKIEPVDIITFGSPCQDMSVAGKRAGLDGSRSSLFHEAIRIIKEMREATNGKYPRYAVWENVPGAFSSNKGEDFRCVLEEFCKVKDETVSVPKSEKWESAGEILGEDYSVAWRVLDAQYWGVPQRRKRIYLVADFVGSSASKILFESEGMSGYTPEGFGAWQKTTRYSSPCLGETGNTGISGGFRPENSMQGSATIGYEDEVAPTLCSKAVPAAVMLDYHPQDSRLGLTDSEAVQTLTSRMGTGGNNVPLIMTPKGLLEPVTLKIRCGKPEGGGKGALLQHNLSATLACNNDQTLFQPKAFGISSKASNAMMSDNPSSGIYEAETSRTLDLNGGNPACNQGGMAVVCVDQGGGKSNVGITEEFSPTLTCTHGGEPVIAVQGSMLGRKTENGPQGSGVNEGGSFTLNTVDRHAVAYGLDRSSFNSGYKAGFGFDVAEEIVPTMVASGPNAVGAPVYSTSKSTYHMMATKNTANTLVASDYKDPPLINSEDEMGYIVRRLTPVECARLQGFPDWWCDGLGNENPSDEEVREWKGIFETFDRACGIEGKERGESQVRKWLKEPYSDSSAYKLWGNGVALPCVAFVLAGIVYATSEDYQQ